MFCSDNQRLHVLVCSVWHFSFLGSIWANTGGALGKTLRDAVYGTIIPGTGPPVAAPLIFSWVLTAPTNISPAKRCNQTGLYWERALARSVHSRVAEAPVRNEFEYGSTRDSHRDFFPVLISASLSRRRATMVKWRARHARSLVIFEYFLAAFVV
jgi:hypothetical protein